MKTPEFEFIHPLVLKATCKGCSYTYKAYGWEQDQMFAAFDCRKCGHVSWAILSDELLREIHGRYKKLLNVKYILQPQLRKQIEKIFSEACDRCDCGGEFVWNGSFCPKCLHDDVEIDWHGAKIIKMRNYRISHFSVDVEQFKKRLDWLIPQNVELYKASKFALPRPGKEDGVAERNEPKETNKNSAKLK